MPGLPGLPPPGSVLGSPAGGGLPGLPPPGFLEPPPTKGQIFAGGISESLIPAFGDELFGGLGALYDKATQGGDLQTQYDHRLKQIRGYQAAYNAQSPDRGIAEGLAGSAPLALIGGAEAEAAPSIFSLAKLGAGYGGLFGFGSGEGGLANRAQNAALGAAAGAVAGPAIGKTVEYGSRAVADYISANPELAGLLSGKRGSVGPGERSVFAPEDLILAKQLKNTPIEKVQAGAAELANTLAADVPLFTAEALKSPKVFRNARFVANYEPSLEFSQSAIEGRSADASKRATDLFDAISPERDQYQGASKLVGGANTILDTAEQAREAAAKPLYEIAYSQEPTVSMNRLKPLYEKDKEFSSAVDKVRRTGNNAGLADNSTQLLVKVRQELSNKIEHAKANGQGRLAGDLSETWARLNNVLHVQADGKTATLLDAADTAYFRGSGNLEYLNSTFLNSLSKMTGDKVQNVSQILKLPEARIANLRGLYKDAGLLDEWNAGIRAHLQTAVEDTRPNFNFADRLAGKTLQKDKLQAALGDSFDPVVKGLDLENRMFKGKNLYHAGSSTEGNFQEAADFRDATGFLGKVKSKDWAGALAHLFQSDLPEETAQALARIYFDPKTGSERVNKIIPLLEEFAKNKSFAGLAGQATTAGSGIAAGEGSALLNPQTSSKSVLRPSSPASVFSGAKKMDALPPKTVQVEQKIAADPFDAAVYKAESNENPKAKNPHSSAKGGFQITDSTAKSLGLKDPYDLSENFDAFKKLKAEHQKIFGDNPILLYSAHVLGSPLLTKVLKKKPLNEQEAANLRQLTDEALPRFLKIYNSTVQEAA